MITFLFTMPSFAHHLTTNFRFGLVRILEKIICLYIHFFVFILFFLYFVFALYCAFLRASSGHEPQIRTGMHFRRTYASLSTFFLLFTVPSFVHLATNSKFGLVRILEQKYSTSCTHFFDVHFFDVLFFYVDFFNLHFAGTLL